MIKFVSFSIGLFSCFFIALTAQSVDPKIFDKKVNDYIHKCPLAVISTISAFNYSSESALIAFTQNEKLELYFMTFADSRKYTNLQNNHNVSLVIGFGYTTIQYEGMAHQLEEEVVKEALHAFSIKETPCTPDFLNNPRARFFKIIPKWIRYSDYSVCPAEILEKSW
ncbi:MAG: pyridoxamine 5'-phosphate oxidase family protein [Proteobacteria bacterium]|nr:pyridoxamine 5'-phosphate oxidase family protein [Pseudomonadota bacterium]